MEIFGLRKVFVLNFTRFPLSEHYMFLFEREPQLDLEKATYTQLLEECDGMFVVNAIPTADWNNVYVLRHLFIPKYSTLLVGEQAATVQDASNAVVSANLAKHLAYSPTYTVMGSEESSLRWFECAACKTTKDAANLSNITFNTGVTPIEYTFDRPISANCFVINQTTSVRRSMKIEALVDDQWIVCVASYTPGNTLSAVTFDSVVSNKFRISFSIDHAITMSSAYFGKMDYVAEDINEHEFSFVKAIVSPSLKMGYNSIKLNSTSSSIDTEGFDLPCAPCMLMDVSNSDTSADILVTVQDNLEHRLGLYIIGGYVI